jgi:hypothetical protein
MQYPHRPDGGRSSVNPIKFDQDRWLAEAVAALAEAERLTGLLAFSQSRYDLALVSLQAEIMTLRREIERVQRERSGGRQREFHPDWLKESVWDAACSVAIGDS